MPIPSQCLAGWAVAHGIALLTLVPNTFALFPLFLDEGVT